ncbi:MAG: prolyl oligopeptidase family serine peptidase [Pirellulales bacterium]|nr:prolyl oligopeptidase family serine peptidase [Pirellulales bacterium]
MKIRFSRPRRVAWGSCAMVLALHALGPGTAAADPKEGPKSHQGEITYVEDLVYGRVHGAGLLADVAYPASAESLPAILSVHGGRWQGGHKQDASAIDVREWAGWGFFAMSIDYRLVGTSPAPACYQDLQCAVRFLHANAERLNIDPTKIYLIGQSAGGHMVSLAATLGDGMFRRTGGWESASNKVAAVISVAANYELNSLSWGKIWTPAGGDPVEARRLASPVNHIGRDVVPLLIIHSDNDASVPIANALLMVEALEAAGSDYVFHRYPEAGHMGITDEVKKKSREFIQRHENGASSE